MSFLTWAALAIGLLVAAPVLAHLLRRRPPMERKFAATELVPATTAVAQRRTAIEDRALLALRTAAILALAVLGATPLIRCSRLSLARPSGGSMAVVMVVDDSLSMRAQVDQGTATRFDSAKQAALELLDSLEQGDAVAVVMAGHPARVALAATSNTAAARSVVEQLTVSDRGTDLSGATKLATALLADVQHVDKRVVLLSDMLAQPAADDSPSRDRSKGTSTSSTRSSSPATAAPQLSVPKGIKLWSPLRELQRPLDDCAVIRADRSGNRVTVQVACSAAARGSAARGGARPRAARVGQRGRAKDTSE